MIVYILLIIVILFQGAILYYLLSSNKNNVDLSTKLNEQEQRQHNALTSLRQEILNYLLKLGDKQVHTLKDINIFQVAELKRITEYVDKLTVKVENNLEKIRETVDERLTSTLNKRLGEQFDLISTRLKELYKQLGEMQELNKGVGDLKKILSGVKTRGVWGEVQLESILSQYFSKAQYEKNVRLGEKTRENVEFALRLPKDNDFKQVVYLPIDSKFPLEPYYRLLEAYEKADKQVFEKLEKEFIASIKNEAKRIGKYVNPPKTTGFAIMYLPAEGLYAEVAQRPGLLEDLHKNFNVMVAGPSTITAFLLSIHMGLRALAIEHHTSKVWEILSKVKHEFSKFKVMLAKTSHNLELTKKNIDEAIKRSDKISNTLDTVEIVPELKPTKQVPTLPFE